MTVLETERLTLRPLTGDDFDDYAAMMATLNAQEVISVIRPGNTRSIAVAERIGHHYLHETDYNNAPALIYGQQSAAL